MKKSLLLVISVCASFLLDACGGGSVMPPPQVAPLAIAPQFIFLTVGNAEQLNVLATLTDGSTVTPQSLAWAIQGRSVPDSFSIGG